VNWVDIAILIALAWLTYSAFHAGFIREVVTIFSAVLAVAMAGLLYEKLAEDIQQVAVDNLETAEIIAFGIIFGAVILTGQLLAMFLKQAASLLMLGLFDSMGGALIGLIKGFVFVEIALIAGVTFEDLGVREAILDSAFADFFLQVLPVLKYILPGQFDTALDELPS
jgi:uncharacterized membrane protein required for colicin V production